MTGPGEQLGTMGSCPYSIFSAPFKLKIENDLLSLLSYFEALINSLKNRLEAEKKVID